MIYSFNVWQLALVISSFLSTSAISHTDAACVSLIKNNPNAKFNASTSSFGPGYPVLHSNQFWCAGVINENQSLVVDLGLNNLTVDRVSVQGMPNTTRSVSQYLLLVSTENINFFEVLEAKKSRKVFFGPRFNGDTVVSTNLTMPAPARWVAFNPEEPMNTTENNLCMRVDVLSCGKAPTPVDGGLSQWSSWSQCSCNQVTTRTRSCTNPAPAFGGRPCQGHETEQQFCINTNCAPNWSNWSNWTTCSATCGRGLRTRVRLCKNPPPPPGGNVYCVGLPVETEGCTVRDCPTCVSLITDNPNAKFYASTSLFPLGHPVLHSNQFWCAGVINRGQRLVVDLGLNNLMVDRVSVQGMPGTRRSVSEYLVFVSTDNKTFTGVLEAEDGRKEFLGPRFNGDTVVSSNLTMPAPARWVVFNPEEPLTPNEYNLCMRVDVLSCGKAPTPVDGGLSQWSSWSQCSCNQVTTRTRSCTNPAPAFGGRPCQGHEMEHMSCTNTYCDIENCIFCPMTSSEDLG